MAQHALAQIRLAPERIEYPAFRIARDGVDGEVATRKILLERDVGRGMKHEAAVAATTLALRARERIFLVRIGMQEHRKIASNRTKPNGQHRLGRGTHDDEVTVHHRAPKQLVADGTANAVDLHVRDVERPKRIEA